MNGGFKAPITAGNSGGNQAPGEQLSDMRNSRLPSSQEILVPTRRQRGHLAALWRAERHTQAKPQWGCRASLVVLHRDLEPSEQPSEGNVLRCRSPKRFTLRKKVLHIVPTQESSSPAKGKAKIFWKRCRAGPLLKLLKKHENHLKGRSLVLETAQWTPRHCADPLFMLEDTLALEPQPLRNAHLQLLAANPQDEQHQVQWLLSRQTLDKHEG